MKVCIINVTAKSGSTGKIAYGQYKNLKAENNDAILFYGRNDLIDSESIIKVDTQLEIYIHVLLARLTGLHGYFSTNPTKKIIKILKKDKPDVVQLYNLHGYYININLLFKYLSENNIVTIYSMLDEYPYLGRCCYSYNCDEFQNGCRKCKINKREYPQTWFFRQSRKFYNDKIKDYNYKKLCFTGPQWVINRAKQSPMMKGKKFYCVDEYVDTDNVFFPRKSYKYVNKEIDNNKIIILTVAPYSNPRKGGKYFLELAKSLHDDDKFQFVYVGMNVEGVDIPKNVIVKGFISNQDELAEYYSIADLFVCTSIADTMPNVCLDSLACGTPILGFNVSGIPFVAEKPIGNFVSVKRIDELKSVVLKTKKKTQLLIDQCRKYALKRYSPQIYYKKMKKIYEEMMS